MIRARAIKDGEGDDKTPAENVVDGILEVLTGAAA